MRCCVTVAAEGLPRAHLHANPPSRDPSCTLCRWREMGKSPADGVALPEDPSPAVDLRVEPPSATFTFCLDAPPARGPPSV